jgi:hypothetical protein
MYDNDQAFLNLVGHAGLGPQTERAIHTAVQVGFGPAKTPHAAKRLN